MEGFEGPSDSPSRDMLTMRSGVRLFALARAGVGELVVVDFDIIEEPNLNRQAYTLDQVGEKKVVGLKKNIEQVTRSCRVEIVDRKIEMGDAKEVFNGCQVVICFNCNPSAPPPEGHAASARTRRYRCSRSEAF